jgi:protein-tyrosine-phosphatase
MAAAFMAQRLEGTRVSADIRSSGLLVGSYPPPDEVISVMEKYGIELRGFRSRKVAGTDLASSDLVVAMTQGHVRELVLIDHLVLPRTFTLSELVRRGREVGERSPDMTEQLWVASVAEGRSGPPVGRSRSDDIPDPYGRRLAVYKKTAGKIKEEIDELVGLLWPVL